jgi:hypothetical protein
MSLPGGAGPAVGGMPQRVSECMFGDTGGRRRGRGVRPRAWTDPGMREQRMVFGEVADLYNKARAGYAEPVVDEVLRFAGGTAQRFRC